MWKAILQIIAAIAGMFDPEEKKKQYRVKLQELKKEKAKLLATFPCTNKISKRLVQIELEIKKIELYLQS